MIRFEQVSYAYPGATAPALRDLSLRIAEGEFVLVAGPSGAGKSTFLRCINGLVPHFHGGSWQGRVLVAGRDTRAHEPRSLSDVVGFVFQDPEAQMVVDIVEDELVFGMENLGLDARIMRRRVEEVLDQLEIAHLRRRRLSTLSGGERQRVAIAAVLTALPQVLVLDEPTSQLDPHSAEEVLTALQKLNADLGLTIVLSEHRLERVVQYVDRVVFCRGRGQMPEVEIGSPEQVLRSAPFAPPLVAVARNLGWDPLPLTIKAGRRFVAGMTLPAVPDVPQSAREHRWWRKQASLPAATGLWIAGLSVELDGRPVLRAIDTEVEPGEIVAIMGRNGSGKTTLLRSIMGLVRTSSGRIFWQGQDISRLATEERAGIMGYVPQDPRAVLFQPTVQEEVAWALAQGGAKRQRDASETTRITAMLAQFGLEHLAGAHPRDLSAGEQQRTALATALVRDPAVLLLDEPTRGLDYLAKDQLIAILHALLAKEKVIILVTHDVELVAACAGRVVLLGEGEIVTTGPTRTILHESLLFSSQIGKLFPGRRWLTAREAISAIAGAPLQTQ